MGRIKLTERRKDPRAASPVAVKIQIEGTSEAYEHVARNLSSGGFFVETDSPLPVDTPVSVRFYAGSLDITVEAKGYVVRSQPETAGSKTHPGMAIQFREGEKIGGRLLQRLLETQ